MKAISLWQPWASLMAAGYKRIETRSWAPYKLRTNQLVAIHAAKRWTEDERDICQDDPFFKRYLMLAERRGLWDFATPPLGAVIAIARFQGAYPVEQIYYASHREGVPPERAARMRFWVSDHERAFGNYHPGRYGWVFSEVRPLRPIPTRGMQGLFDWQPPADLGYVEARSGIATPVLRPQARQEGA